MRLRIGERPFAKSKQVEDDAVAIPPSTPNTPHASRAMVPESRWKTSWRERIASPATKAEAMAKPVAFVPTTRSSNSIAAANPCRRRAHQAATENIASGRSAIIVRAKITMVGCARMMSAHAGLRPHAFSTRLATNASASAAETPLTNTSRGYRLAPARHDGGSDVM